MHCRQRQGQGLDLGWGGGSWGWAFSFLCFGIVDCAHGHAYAKQAGIVCAFRSIARPGSGRTKNGFQDQVQDLVQEVVKGQAQDLVQDLDQGLVQNLVQGQEPTILQ